MNRGRDRDDWFDGAEPDRSRAPQAGDEEAGEDWLLEDLPPPRPRLDGIDQGVLVIAAVGIGFLIAVLSAAGVFSSAPKISVATVPSTLTLTTPTTQPTTSPRAQPVPVPTANLKPGDTGAQVNVLQRALARLGFSTGNIDSQYGSATVAAVKRFQRSTGLTVDGIVGPATLSALATALLGLT